MTSTPTWRKSSYSAGSQQCVELADAAEHILMRDSKHPNNGHITLDRTDLAALVAACRAGTLDPLR